MPSGSVCLVGLGNVGSQIVPLLARSAHVSRLTLVDPGRYGRENLRSQNIGPGDVGLAKGVVQARVSRAINPGLPVRVVRAAVEDVPPGRLRADVLMSAPDTRRARQHVNRLAWRLGVPAWIDVGIDASAQLVRVTVFRPHDDGACLECGWGGDDYAVVEASFSCAGGAAMAPPPTGASAALGALAAARAVLLCEDLLAQRGLAAAAGAARPAVQLTFALREHRAQRTTLGRSSVCRFDHQPLALEHLAADPEAVTLGHLQSLVARDDDAAAWQVEVDACTFARTLACDACAATRIGWRLVRPTAGTGLRCDCGGAMTATAFDSVSRLESPRLAPDDLDRSLDALGFRRGDVLVLASSAASRAIEIGAPPAGGLAVAGTAATGRVITRGGMSRA